MGHTISFKNILVHTAGISSWGIHGHSESLWATQGHARSSESYRATLSHPRSHVLGNIGSFRVNRVTRTGQHCVIQGQ